MKRKLYYLNLLDINGDVTGTISRYSYLPRHLFFTTMQAKVRRGRLGRYVNGVSFKTQSIPAFLQYQAN